MKLITKFKSSNFNKRHKSKISLIIIHYTSLINERVAIDHLCNPKNKVSSHYLVSQKGLIYSLVDDKHRAWHAGISEWNDYKDINSISIGIELDFSYDFKNNKFTKEMIFSLKKLINELKIKYKIKNKNILGHSDIAPYRKIDPGNKFPWYNLSLINFKNNKFYKINITSLDKWFHRYNFNSNKRKVLFLLKSIGYDVSKAQKNNINLKRLICIYQSHYLQKNISGIIDDKTLSTLKLHMLSLLLT